MCPVSILLRCASVIAKHREKLSIPQEDSSELWKQNDLKMLRTLHVWKLHEVEQARKHSVGCGVSPSKMEIQKNGTQLVFREG